MKYPVKIQARIKLIQYEKIMESGMDCSAYIRDAIDFFDCNTKKEIEKSKKELLDELKENISLNDEYLNKFLEEQKLQKENIKKAIEEEYKNCDNKLKEIEEEEKRYKVMNIEKPEKRSNEEIIMEILPTLQGFNHSEDGITYSKLRNLNNRGLDISPKVLMTWTKENKELVEKRDYMKRNVIKYEGVTHSMDDKEEDNDDERIY